jgi:hypothetical protein
MPILASPKSTERPHERLIATPDSRSTLDAWRVVGWVGLAFVIMGATDIALAWYPTAFGNPEWEFGAIAATLNGFALPLLGLFLVLASAVARRRRIVSLAVSVIAIVLFLALAVLAFVYVTVIPLALKSVAADPILTLGMRKAVVKALVLFIAYAALFAAAAVRGIRTRQHGG